MLTKSIFISPSERAKLFIILKENTHNSVKLKVRLELLIKVYSQMQEILQFSYKFQILITKIDLSHISLNYSKNRPAKMLKTQFIFNQKLT